MEHLRFLDLSNNEVTKEQGYREFVLQKLTKNLKFLDGYVLSIMMCIICVLININIYNSRDSIVNGLTESASDSEGGGQDGGEDGGSESEGKLNFMHIYRIFMQKTLCNIRIHYYS